ncbi:response regulator [Kribbella sp. NPDC020789]
MAGLNRAIRVVIVDDDALVRSALAMILRDDPAIEVAGEAADGLAGVELVESVAPDVVLMDIRMPGLDGLEALGRLTDRPVPANVIMLTTFDADDDVLRALRAGASGFLLKHTPPPEIVEAVHRVAAGEHMLSPSVTAQLIARLRQTEPQPQRVLEAQALAGTLTDREREVAVAVGDGKVNAQIAGELFLSMATVKAHVSRIMVKLVVTNRVQLANRVHDAGLLRERDFRLPHERRDCAADGSRPRRAPPYWTSRGGTSSYPASVDLTNRRRSWPPPRGLRTARYGSGLSCRCRARSASSRRSRCW